jgi:F-type H+-transporting ATPase subunit b
MKRLAPFQLVSTRVAPSARLAGSPRKRWLPLARRVGTGLALGTLFVGMFLAGFPPQAAAQENATGQKAGEAGGSDDIWRVVNFVIMAGAVGYLIVKNAGPFFAARLRKIREEIVQGEDARQEAEQRAAEVDRRLANLEADITGLRAESQREAEREFERMRERTAAEMAKIHTQAEQEIASAGKTARAELKRYAAELAIGLAERKIRTRMNAETQDGLVAGFVHELETPPEARVH